MKHKKHVSFLLALVLVVSLFVGTSITAYADSTTYYISYNSLSTQFTVPDGASSAISGDTLEFQAVTTLGSYYVNLKGGSSSPWNCTDDGSITVSTGGQGLTAIIPEGYQVKSITTEGSTIKVEIESVSSDSATSAELDLESSTTDIPASTDIQQEYLKTTGDKTTYNNRVTMLWSGDGLTVKVTNNKKWDPYQLCWVDDATDYGKAEVMEDSGASTITLRNYSARSFKVTAEFVLNENLSNEMKETYDASKNTLVFKDGKDTLDAVEYGDDGIADVKYFTDSTRTTIDDTKLPTVTLTENLGINQSEFDYMSSASGSYGSWKITLTVIE